MFHLPSTKSSYIQLEGFERPAVEPPELPDPVLVRRAGAADEAAIRTLARLDSRRPPDGPLLVAELSGHLVAAISLTTRDVVADPFRRTADAVAVLLLRAAQIADEDARAHAPGRHAAFNPAAA